MSRQFFEGSLTGGLVPGPAGSISGQPSEALTGENVCCSESGAATSTAETNVLGTGEAEVVEANRSIFEDPLGDLPDNNADDTDALHAQWEAGLARLGPEGLAGLRRAGPASWRDAGGQGSRGDGHSAERNDQGDEATAVTPALPRPGRSS